MEAARIIDRHVELVEGAPIRWGRDDCAMWVAGVLRDIHKQDLGKGWRKLYRSEPGARRALKGGSLLRAVASTCRKHGWKRKAPSEAQPGDLGMFNTPERGLACVVCLQGGPDPWWVGRIEHGVSYLRHVPPYAWGPPCRQ